jgi:predicted nucleotidyltransferase
LLTAGVKRVDRGAVESAVRAWVREVAERSEVVRVTWYGSFVTGVATPRSDVDVCVVVRDDTTTPRHMRGADYAPTVPTPTTFDVAVLTEDEAARLAEWAPTWSRAIASGEVLFERDS